MSKTYRVKLGTVEGAGRDERRIACPKIVPEMPVLLGAALAAQGWDVDEVGNRARKRFNEVEATVTLDDPSLELKTAVSVAVVGRSYQPDDNEVLGKAEARADGAARRGEFQQQADAKAAQALIDVDDAVRAEVAGAVKVALLEALTRKAQQLGRIASIEQGTDADGRPMTTIKVEV